MRSPTSGAGSKGRALLLVIAWRSEAVPPGHRLRRLALDLVRERRAAIVSPARLDEDEVATLVHAVRSSDAVPDLVRRVYVESEGLPLFVAEYLAALRAGGGPDEERLPDAGAERARRTTGRTRRRGASGTGRGGGDRPILRPVHAAPGERTQRRGNRERARGAGGAGCRARGLGTRARLRLLAPEAPRARLRADKPRTAPAAPRARGGRAVAAAARARRARRSSLRTCAWPVTTRAQRERYRLAAEHAASLHAHADALEHLEAALALGDTDAGELHRAHRRPAHAARRLRRRPGELRERGRPQRAVGACGNRAQAGRCAPSPRRVGARGDSLPRCARSGAVRRAGATGPHTGRPRAHAASRRPTRACGDTRA